MDSFTYYFDVSFLPTEFDSFFSKQVIDEHVPEPIKTKTLNKKYVPQVMEASSLEFKRSKTSNRK